MIVIPAIDLRGGRAVRLLRGDPAAETVYADDPVALAVRFQEEGARRLHLVDLDAALEEGDNREVITEICRSVVVPVQVGGGRAHARRHRRVLEAGRHPRDPRDRGRARPLVRRARGRGVRGADRRRGRRPWRPRDGEGWTEEGPLLEDVLPALDDAGSPGTS